MKKLTIFLGALGIALLISCAVDGDKTTGGGDGGGTPPTTNAPLYTDGRWFKDVTGRVVILRGINMGVEIKHVNPETGEYEYFRTTGADWDNLVRWGFNVARLLLNWAAVEPVEGKYDEAFLDRLEEQVELARARGIYVMLDMHQDTWGPAFDGNGAPVWASRTDIPFERNPLWGLNYFAPAVMASFDTFYEKKGLRKKYGNMWAHVAKRFTDYENVVGFDLMNEPNPGSRNLWDVERKFLAPMFDRVAGKIREVDPERIVFYEPCGYTAGGMPSFMPPPKVEGGNVAFAPHYYDSSVGLVHTMPYDGNYNRMAHAMMLRDRESLALGNIPWIYGEFGIDSGVNYMLYLRHIYDQLELHMASNIYWCYGKSDGGMVPLDSLGNDKPRVTEMSRPYPQKVAGTPLQWKFDQDTKAFELTVIEDPSIEEPTEIFIPDELHYPDGFDVDATGDTWSTEWDGRILKWYSDKKYHHNTIFITPIAVGAPEAENPGIVADAPEAGEPPVSKSLSNDPVELIDAADAILGKHLTESMRRTEALFMYEKALTLTGSDNVNLRARAHLGLGMINFYDAMDVLPTLFEMIGLDIMGMLGSLGMSPAAVPPAPNMGVRAACDNPVDVSGIIDSIDILGDAMIEPALRHFRKFMELNPNKYLVVENGQIVLTFDHPETPENEFMGLDLSGEWDAGDVGVVMGGLDAILAVIKALTAYDGLLQSFLNPGFNPDCNPSPGSTEWNDVFGPYGTLAPDGGYERMVRAGELLEEAFYSMGFSFWFIQGETDDQSDDIIIYLDCGTDQICPDNPAYVAPDENGTEGNGQYDPGEPWGILQIAIILDQLLAESGLPISYGVLTAALSLPVTENLMYDMGDSVENGTPLDLVQSLLKPLLVGLGMGEAIPDQLLYTLGLPALNLSAPFNPPWPDLTQLDPLTDEFGTMITEVESVDTTHTWPDGSGRVDPMNGVVDPQYLFWPDTDLAANSVGVIGGLLYEPITTEEDFDVEGNLTGVVDYVIMMNPAFNRAITGIMSLLESL